MADTLAAKRVEVSIITFGPVNTITEFTTADYFSPPNLSTTGDTPMGAAIVQGVELIRKRKEIYKSNGIASSAQSQPHPASSLTETASSISARSAAIS